MAKVEYMKPVPREVMREQSIRNLMGNLERAQGVPTANVAYGESMHRMLKIYLNGGPR